MRKIFGLFVLMVGIVFLSGCALENDSSNLSFDESYDVFVDNLFSVDILSMLDVVDNDVLQDDLSLKLDGGNSDTELSVDLDIDSITEIKTSNSETNFDFVVSWLDLVKNLPLDLSGNLEMKFLSGNLYANIHDFSMDSGPGNAEANLVSLVIKNYMHKWILMDDPNTIDVSHLDSSKIIDTYKFPQKIKESLKKYHIFDLELEAKIQGNVAYKLILNSGEFMDFIDYLDMDLDLSGLEFYGDIYLIPHSDDDVSLLFDKFGLVSDTVSMSGDSLYEVSGEIDGRKVDLNIQDFLEDDVYKLFLGQRKDILDLNISKTNSLGETNSLALDIDAQKINSGVDFKFKGDVDVSPMQFYEPLSLEIDGIYHIDSVEFSGFEIPENTLLLQQILGDQFALPAMIEE